MLLNVHLCLKSTVLPDISFHTNTRLNTFSITDKGILAIVNPFVPNAPFLYPLKTLEYLTVFWCFQGVEKGCVGNEWVKSLDPNKSHGWDNISINMIKMCGESLVLPLKMILETVLMIKSSQMFGRKVNIVPVHKKKVCS